ncbi:adenosylcobinamide-GDP ribazoletransferase [Clostridium folliculivorans]|uniref:Adenosylcobinamide-GDP ribazoletransferase n=1 Tax=Clostridium folliculivorans TaxID=2886038 RepID=A0A9W5Y4T9_9CLOT|nr:adenosylcobinamide-GDP ribazoletransferase [Clostridium folliculivorans]GKU26751.1 adenosylcobinamide-GDP ribazoletransferase [Clostridium folliculivorans]GKU31345.1 adenosylcobinamide-GDP ribazoletransferase [Clostridium folliculivorans]
MKKFILIIQFMTRIPINLSLEVKREDFADAVRYFPLVGLIIGAIDLFVYIITSKVFHGMLPAVFAMISHIIVTGGLHLDGLSDTADGIFSGRSKDKILEIMKDSRVGTFGVLALIALMLLKFAAIQELSKVNIYSVLLISPVISRTLATLLMYKRRYARQKEGLGDLFIGKISTLTFSIALALGLIITLAVGRTYGLIVIIVGYIFTILFRLYIEKRLDGITGDILGASVELNEVLVLIVFCLLQSLI